MNFLTISAFVLLQICSSLQFDEKCSARGERCILPIHFGGEWRTSCVRFDGVAGRVCPVEFLPDGKARVAVCSPCAGDALCYVKANEHDHFSIRCPPSCIDVSEKLWGTNAYSIDSFVCAAGLHAGIFQARTGGSVTVNRLPISLLPYVGSVRNKMRSLSRPARIRGFQPIIGSAPPIPIIAYLDSNKLHLIRGFETMVLSEGLGDLIALDVDIRRNTFYWSDVHLHKIFRSNFLSHPSIRITSEITLHNENEIDTCEGLAVDWVHENLYWTDVGHYRVMVSTSAGNYVKTLIERGKEYLPRAIAVDPRNGYMYVSDWGQIPKIEKCSMAGGDNCETLVRNNITWPNGLSLDYSQNRLYWVDAKLPTLSSCRLDGSDRRDHVTSTNTLLHPFGITIFNNRVYWTDWRKLRLQSVDKVTGSSLYIIAAGLDRPSGVKILDPTQQPLHINRCKNSDCQYLCLISPGGPQCECPNGMVPLTRDKSRCSSERNITITIFISDHSTVKRIEYDRGKSLTHESSIASFQEDVRDVAVDNLLNQVYWNDIGTKAIRSRSVNDDPMESTIETFLQGSKYSTSLREPRGLAVDWINRNLYWADTDLHSVYVTDLAQTAVNSRRQFARLIFRNSSYSPRAIALSPQSGFMYVTDSGTQPKIEKCWMNGASCTTIIEKNIAKPYGITIDFGTNRIYWTDFLLKTISYCNLDGQNRNMLINNNLLENPFGIAVHYDRVYWTDWTRGTVSSVDKTSGEDFQNVFSDLQQPTGLDIPGEYVYPPSVSRCHRDACRYMCTSLPITTRNEYICVCPIFQPFLEECASEEISARKHGLLTFDCGVGMQLSRDLSQCEDMNECLSDKGGCEQMCLNTLGSYMCDCGAGYSLSDNGHTCKIRLTVCNNNPCSNNGSCSTTREAPGYRCKCLQGFRGTRCDDVFGVILVSLNPIQTGQSFFLECVVPAVVTHAIIWRRNREEIFEGTKESILENGRKLMVFHATYLQAGEYRCQFQFNDIEYVARRFVVVQTHASDVCGKAIGIDSGTRERQPRIFGGSITAAKAAPFMVLLYKITPDPTHIAPGVFCGGSLLDNKRILTAAHCVYYLGREEIVVYIGKLSADVDVIEPYQQSANISNILLHPDYSYLTLHADFAILTISSSFYYTAGVKPICVPSPQNKDEELIPRPLKGNSLKYGLVFGWGLISPDQRSRVLREVKLPIRNQAYCRRIHNDVTSLMFCAGGGSVQDACHGDSGGPFALWSTRSETWSVGGIVSWGDGCGRPDRPGVYARVGRSIREWIYNNTSL